MSKRAASYVTLKELMEEVGVDATRFLRSHSALGSEASHVAETIEFVQRGVYVRRDPEPVAHLGDADAQGALRAGRGCAARCPAWASTRWVIRTRAS